MNDKASKGSISLMLTAEELDRLQAILRWTKASVQCRDKEKLAVERILHKIRKLIP